MKTNRIKLVKEDNNMNKTDIEGGSERELVSECVCVIDIWCEVAHESLL